MKHDGKRKRVMKILERNKDIKLCIKWVYKHTPILQGNKFTISLSLKHSHYQYSNNIKYTMKNATNEPKFHN